MSSDPAAKAAGAAEPWRGYGDILRASALIGSSSLVGVVCSVLRTKALAVLLGPAGVGLAGLYGSVADMVRGLAQLGIGSSGVRQIAACQASGDLLRLARVADVVRRLSWLLGLGGAAVLVLARERVSTIAFGDPSHAAGVALLGAVVALGVVADGHGALLQGTRRIRALAVVAVSTALAGTVIGIAAVFVAGSAGIVPALVATAAVSAAAAWWQARRVGGPVPAAASRRATLADVAGLLRLGVAFMASGLVMTGAYTVVRIAVREAQGLEAVGLYQGAWMVGGVYVGFVLQALSTDFYPRLVALAHDDAATNELVNRQAHVSLLLAAPGVLATLTFAPLVLALLYSSRFDAAAGLLRWFCIGMALRVVTWPMGFIVVARGHAAVFFCIDLVWAICFGAASWLGLRQVGLEGAGIAFAASYVLHGAVVTPAVRRISGFRWSAANLRTAAALLVLAALAFGASAWLPTGWATAVGATLTAGSALHSLRRLTELAGRPDAPGPATRLLRWRRQLQALVGLSNPLRS